MVHQYYFQQKVNAKRGENTIKGKITDFIESKNEYVVKTDFGDTLSLPEQYLEPDYDGINPYTYKNFN